LHEEDISLKLGICDNEKEDLQKIFEICKKTLSKAKLECEIVQYNDGRKVLSDISKIDLLILDIDMPYISGIDIKNQLQYYNKNIIIIFVTNYIELMQESFGINVYGFIQKKNIDMQLNKILISAIKLINQYVLIDGVIDSRKIRYIKSDRVYCDLFIEGGKKKITRISLNQYEKMLTNVGFVRTHRSYLVNLMWIDGITDKGVKVGEEIIPISTRLRKKVKLSFKVYCAKNGRYC